ncbi:hypothetical protein [Mycolicibacterium sp. XJ775]
MARDHARINLDLWGDDDWMDLSVDAQMLYLTLYTNPGLSFCGAGEWHPGRIAARATDWNVPRIEAAAVELSRRLFVIIDTDTAEYLLRSWIKHDGLWRTPNMAVTVANARGELSSRTLRGVIVFEVAKLKRSHPDSTSWDRPAVQKMLTQKAIDATDLEPFNPGPKGGAKGGSNPCANPTSKGGRTDDLTPPSTVVEREANPGSKGGPTPAPTPSSYSNSKMGYVSTEGNEEPPSRCPAHLNHPNPPRCPACADARRAHEAWEKAQRADEVRHRRAIKAARTDCPHCDSNGLVETADGMVRCTAHDEPEPPAVRHA